MFHVKGYAQDVYYAGFSYLGSSEFIDTNLSNSNRINSESGDTAKFDRFFLKKLQSKKFSFNLITDKQALLGDEEALTLTLALQNEKTSIEKIGSVYKLLIELEGQLLFFDFNTMSIVASFPINTQFIDVTKTRPSEEYIRQQYHRIFLGDSKINFFKVAAERLSTIKPKRHYKNHIQLLNADVAQKAFSKSPLQNEKQERRLTEYYAQSFSQLLSSNQEISVLPYTKGQAISNKLAGKYANGEVYALAIPEPDYAIVLSVLAFKKRLFSNQNAGNSYIYAAQAEFKFYEPLSGKIYYQGKLFNGESKVVPASQTEVDDWAAYNDTLKLLFHKVTQQLNSPDKSWFKKHSGNSKDFKSFKNLKRIIDQCR